jgi:hypothetical protein
VVTGDRLALGSASNVATGSNVLASDIFCHVTLEKPELGFDLRFRAFIRCAQTNSYAHHVEGIDATNVGFRYAAAQT